MLSTDPFLLTCYSLTKTRNLTYRLPTNCVNQFINWWFLKAKSQLNSSRLSLSNSLFRSARVASVYLDNSYMYY